MESLSQWTDVLDIDVIMVWLWLCHCLIPYAFDISMVEVTN